MLLNVLFQKVFEKNFLETNVFICKDRAINSLAPGKFELNFRYVIFKQILVIDGQFYKTYISHRFNKISLKIIYLNFHSNFPGSSGSNTISLHHLGLNSK